MRYRCRRKPRVSRFLLALTPSMLGVGLLLSPEKPLFAQTNPPQAQTPQDAKPQETKPAPPTTAPAASMIGEIIVLGNKNLNESYIIGASGHKVGDPCTDQVLNEMKTNLTNTGNFGMHSNDISEWVKVTAKERSDMPGKCQVVIQVDENDLIRGVNITGTGPLKVDEVRPLLHVTDSKTVYNENQLARDILDIQDLYNRKGYIAVLGQDPGMDTARPGILNIPILVTRVVEIKIVNNHKTRRNVILREMKTKQGDYFNFNTLNGDIRRLYNLDLFEDVRPAQTNLGAGRIGLTISVTEKRTGIVSAGIGFSNRQQLIGRAEITETNFRGTGETINLLWETGGAVNRNSVVLGFTEPWLDNRHTLLNVQLYDRTIFRFANTLSSLDVGTAVGTDNRYNEQRTGASVTLGRPIRETYNGSLTLRAENVRTDSLDLPPADARIIQNGPIYSLTGTLIHNSRDLDLDPVSGNFQTASLQVGTADLKPPKTANGVIVTGNYGSVNFTKALLDLRSYYSLSGPRKRTKIDEDKTSLALRLALGGSAGTLPFFEQFFVGGAESLRGYREDRFWGNNYFLGSIEFRQPLARKLKGVVFLDIGDAWGGPYGDVMINGFTQSGFSLRTGVGVGLRVGTPIGPLRLDFGFGSEGGRTHFSIGNVF